MLGGGAYFEERNEKEGVPYDAPAMPEMKEVFGPSKADLEKAVEEVRQPQSAARPAGLQAGPCAPRRRTRRTCRPARPDSPARPPPACRTRRLRSLCLRFRGCR